LILFSLLAILRGDQSTTSENRNPRARPKEIKSIFVVRRVPLTTQNGSKQ
jgi:hypothetical protein